ncbi:hypothetical protein H4R24_000903 [Coemansia sp. RSA 988]|nr:hypothetical protein H4R24_000903 [Coemansia sp. RSA 988]
MFVATAQKETKKVKDDLKDSEIERKKLVDSYNEEKTKAESYKKASNSLRTIISKIKLMTIRLENEIANKSRHIDEQKKRIENLTAELSEQQRVVASMGDVRATNEQLARALKKERTRLETKSELNMNLGRRIYHLETENAELKRAADQPINSQNVITPFSATTSSTQAKKDIPVVDLVSESSHDPDLSEDAEAISDAIMNPWLRYNAPSSQRKLGSTFGVSLKSIESPHSQAFTGVESNKTSSSQANANNANPFAIAEKSFVTLASKEFTFSADVAPQQSTPSSSDRSTRAIQKPTTANVSNGFGGSPRRYFARKHTNTVQAKINWGPKK